jgi:hypothetical protein
VMTDVLNRFRLTPTPAARSADAGSPAQLAEGPNAAPNGTTRR